MTTTAQILPVTETARPADEAAVVALLRKAARTKTAVYPIGGGTSLNYGLRPSRPGIGLSTAALNSIVDYPSSDLTVTVDAGLPLSELNRRLASHRQWLPIEVPQAQRATVGGILATNSCGPRRYSYGTIRDYVLGVRAVDGRGEAFSSGGRVVKNAAGFNIPRLLVGSFGTLGVITQVTLMVQPLPQSSAFVTCDIDEFELAECLLAGLTRSQTLPAAIELLAGPPQPGSPLPPLSSGSVARLLVAFDGNPAEVQWMVRRLSSEWNTVEAGPITTVTENDVEPVWNWLNEFAADLQINVLPSSLVQIVEEVIRLVPGVSIQAHAGSGVIRAAWSPSATSDGADAMMVDGSIAAAFTAMLRDKLRPAVAAAGGSLVVLSQPEGAELNARDVWGTPVDGGNVMRAMLERFDPKGILNPGRFVFGSD